MVESIPINSQENDLPLEEQIEGSRFHSMDSLGPPSRRYYRPELDLVRFAAFCLVCHTLPASPNKGVAANLKGFAPVLYASVNACSFGLSLFFTLSAFLIVKCFLERETTGTLKVKQFYVRRILVRLLLPRPGNRSGCSLPARRRPWVCQGNWLVCYFHGRLAECQSRRWITPCSSCGVSLSRSSYYSPMDREIP